MNKVFDGLDAERIQKIPRLNEIMRRDKECVSEDRSPFVRRIFHKNSLTSSRSILKDFQFPPPSVEFSQAKSFMF